MSLIVDASVVVKWFATEPGSAEASALFEKGDRCVAPVLIIAEVGNALWKKHRKRLVSAEQIVAAMRALPKFLELVELADVAPRAADLAARLEHPIYDCFYLALAERERLPLVTADARMLDAFPPVQDGKNPRTLMHPSMKLSAATV